MSEPFAESPTPASSAADELRAAASGQPSLSSVSAEEKARQLKESAAEKAKELREVATEKTVQFRESASENAQHLRGAASEQWQGTRLKLREFHTEAEEYVRQNPTQSVLGATAVGLVIGLLLRR